MEMFDILALILIFLFWCLLNVWTVSVSRKTFGFCMPVTFMVATLVMFVSGMIFHSFKPGFYLLIIATVAVLIAMANFALLKFLRRNIVYTSSSVSAEDLNSNGVTTNGMPAMDKMIKTVKDNYFSNGFYAFIALFVFFGVLDFGKHLWAWDEFDHWGVMVKEILRLDDLYCVEQANLFRHKDYPPFSSIYMSLWCMLRGHYDEGLVNTAMHVLEFSFAALPVMDWYKGKRTGIKNGVEQLFNGFILVFAVAVFAMSFDTYGIFGTIYPDLLMPLFLVYAAVILLDSGAGESIFGYVAVLLAGICVLLTKQMGICFTLLIWLLYVLVIIAKGIAAKIAEIEAEEAGETNLRVIHSGDGVDIVEENRPETRKLIRKYTIRAALLLILPVSVFFIWKYYIQSLNIVGQFEAGNIEFGRVFEILCGKGTENELLIARNFLGRVLQSDLCCGILYLPYLLLNGLFVLAIIAIVYFFGRDSKQEGTQTCIISALPYVITVIAGAVGYAFTMQVLYLFCFPGETDGGVLPNFTRYMGSYVTGILFIVVVMAIFHLIRKNKELFSVKNFVLVFLFALLTVGKQKFGQEIVPQGLIEEKYSFYHEIADAVKDHSKENDKILIISGNSSQDIVFLQYYLNDRRLSWEYISNDIPLHLEGASFWDEIPILDYDHIFVYSSSDSADKRLAQPGGLERFSAGSLYKIDPTEDGGYSLEFECTGYEL